MATITITTTAEQDAAITDAANLANAQIGSTPLTPVQFFRREIDERLAAWVEASKARRTNTRGELYQRATDAERATIDGILDRYRTT